jgi:hypothetical protein
MLNGIASCSKAVYLLPMNLPELNLYRSKPARLLVMVLVWFSCLSLLNTVGYAGVLFSPASQTTELVQNPRIRTENAWLYKRPRLVFRKAIAASLFNGGKIKQITRLHDSLMKVKFSQLTRIVYFSSKPTWYIPLIRMPQPSADDYLIAARR